MIGGDDCAARLSALGVESWNAADILAWDVLKECRCCTLRRRGDRRGGQQQQVTSTTQP